LRALVLGDPPVRTMGEAGARLHITRSALSTVLNGHADLSIPLAARIEDVCGGCTALDLLQRQVVAKLEAYRKRTRLLEARPHRGHQEARRGR
jgi:plasmid maintenance system antidote protein VapI